MFQNNYLPLADCSIQNWISPRDQKPSVVNLNQQFSDNNTVYIIDKKKIESIKALIFEDLIQKQARNGGGKNETQCKSERTASQIIKIAEQETRKLQLKPSFKSTKH